jgi:hypothetical protein
MKYKCPFCNYTMRFTAYKYMPSNQKDCLKHECKRSDCMFSYRSRYIVSTYDSQIYKISILLNYGGSNYSIDLQYNNHINDNCSHTALLKLDKKSEIISNGGLSYEHSYYEYDKVIQISDVMKIDLTDPINSGLLIIERLMKLRAFS